MQKLILMIMIFTAIIFIGCSVDNASKKTNVNDTTNVKTITIRSNGSSTVYKVNTSNLVTSSSYTNQFGALNTRSYTYDDNKELKSIVKNNSITGSESIYFSTVVDRSANDKITKKIKTIVNSRGASGVLYIDYYYDENGKVIGMVQKDGNGNIIAKGVNN